MRQLYVKIQANKHPKPPSKQAADNISKHASPLIKVIDLTIAYRGYLVNYFRGKK